MYLTMSNASKGSIRQMEPNKPRGKCKTWQLRVRTKLNARTGKYHEKSRTFHGSYRQAQAALADFVNEVENQASSAPARKLTFEELCNEWIEHRLAMRQIAQGTAEKNHSSLNALCRHIGKMPANKLEPYMITDAIKALLSGDSPSGMPLSTTYVLMGIQAGSTMYKSYAMLNGIASKNPFDGVERPRIDTEEREPLTEQQEITLMEQCSPTENHHAAVALALYGGLRRGEVAALDWKHVNLIDGVLLLPDTKGGNKLTAVPMRPKLIKFLLDWKECQAERMAKYGVVQSDETAVCANDLGDSLDKKVLGRWWQRNRARLGCDGVHYHDLRHTFATNLARHNVHPKAIQELMRQKDDRMAMRVYTHVNVQQMREAVLRLED